MSKNKLLYEQPGCKILVVRFEGLLMVSGDPAVDANGTQRSRVVSGIESGFDGWDEM